MPEIGRPLSSGHVCDGGLEPGAPGSERRPGAPPASLRGSRIARLLLELGRERGLRPAQCLAGTGVAHADLRHAGTKLAREQELQVARNVVRELGNPPGLGVEAARRLTLGETGVWGFAVLSSPTWADAGRIALRYWRLTPGRMRLEVESAPAEFRLVLHDAGVPADLREFVAESHLGAGIFFSRLILGEVPPVRFETRLTGENAAALARLLPGGRLLAGRPRHLIAGDPAVLTQPLPQGDRQTWLACERECAAELKRDPDGGAIVSRVRSRLLADPGRIPSMGEVAAELYVDTRTLRRRLEIEGMSFRSLVGTVRTELAVDLLSNTRLSVEEVSQRLGYMDSRSFARAFKRWTGASPASSRAASTLS